jgi:hypothetical protein
MAGITLDELVDIQITDGTDTLAINADGSLNVNFAAGAAVEITDGTDTLAINADGSINVNLTDDGIPDDDPDSGNPFKVGSRAVDGLLSAVSASNDRADLLSDMYRRVWTNSSANVGMTVGTETVGLTAVELAATPLAGRRFITIQNEGTVDVFIGHANTVTTANGIKISKKSSATFELGEDIDVWAISGSAGQDVRVLQAG